MTSSKVSMLIEKKKNLKYFNMKKISRGKGFIKGNRNYLVAIKKKNNTVKCRKSNSIYPHIYLNTSHIYICLYKCSINMCKKYSHTKWIIWAKHTHMHM